MSDAARRRAADAERQRQLVTHGELYDWMDDCDVQSAWATRVIRDFVDHAASSPAPMIGSRRHRRMRRRRTIRTCLWIIVFCVYAFAVALTFAAYR